MTLTNGDATNGSSQLLPEHKVLDYSKALDVVCGEYKEADGLDAKTLLDSKINGGLTYNDFLVLPGYIGIPTLNVACPGCIDVSFQASLPLMLLWTLQSQNEYP